MTGTDVSGTGMSGRRLLQAGDMTEIFCPESVRGFVRRREGFIGKERKDIHDRMTTLSYPIHILQNPKSSKNKKL